MRQRQWAFFFVDLLGAGVCGNLAVEGRTLLQARQKTWLMEFLQPQEGQDQSSASATGVGSGVDSDGAMDLTCAHAMGLGSGVVCSAVFLTEDLGLPHRRQVLA